MTKMTLTKMTHFVSFTIKVEKCIIFAEEMQKKSYTQQFESAIRAPQGASIMTQKEALRGLEDFTSH